jgi:dehydrogenase/reductase SDR family protein 12
VNWRALVDGGLELSVVGSFTRVGPAVRRRLWTWEPLEAHRLDGRVAVVTGATSGLGRAAAERLAGLGATVVMLVRDTARGEGVAAGVRQATGSAVEVVRADLGDLDSVREAAAEVRRHPCIDILVHNAGALNADRRLSAQGIEETVATHVVGPLLLTELCLPQLVAAAPSRVIVVTSGGMYLQPLAVDRLQMAPGEYNGVTAYGRAKRAQVSLVAQCAPQLARRGVQLMVMHPGWADTPGLHRSLPRFHRVIGPLLRSADEGADTIVWLASAPQREIGPGPLWLDRSSRALHRLPGTARSDTVERRGLLLEECRGLAGLSAPPATPAPS